MSKKPKLSAVPEEVPASQPEKTGTLQDIIFEVLRITRDVAEAGGELTPELELRLDFTEIALADKADSYVFICERLEHEADYWSQKAKEFSTVAKGFSRAREHVRSRIKFGMKELGVTEIKGHDFRWALQASKPALVIKDPKLLPAELMMQITEVVPDKERIRFALEQGVEVPGAELVVEGALRDFKNTERN